MNAWGAAPPGHWSLHECFRTVFGAAASAKALWARAPAAAFPWIHSCEHEHEEHEAATVGPERRLLWAV